MISIAVWVSSISVVATIAVWITSISVASITSIAVSASPSHAVPSIWVGFGFWFSISGSFADVMSITTITTIRVGVGTAIVASSVVVWAITSMNIKVAVS